MKTRIASVLILAAALGTSALLPLSAASKDNLPTGYSVSKINFPSSDFPRSGITHIARGTSKGIVSSLMGSPFREVSPDVWFYHGYKADLDVANEQDCDVMVITFAQGKVADLKLVNEHAVRIIAANSTFKQAESYASAK
jgi:hypothetical protein